MTDIMLCYTLALPVGLILLSARWTSGSYVEDTFDTHQQFVQTLVSTGAVTDKDVLEVMKKANIRLYTSKTDYENYPDFDGTNRTDTLINMHAYVLENLKDQLKEGSKVLDIASGSGYLAACMAYLVGKTGKVVGQLTTNQERIIASANIEKSNNEIMDRITFVEGDYTLGVPEYLPYDAIHFGKWINEVPNALLTQLKEGGRLMVTIESNNSLNVYLYDKHMNGTVTSILLDTLPYDKSAPRRLEEEEEEDPKE